MKKRLRIVLKVLAVLAVCAVLFFFYMLRFAPHPIKLYGADGRVKFGYDRIQHKWLVNEYQAHELDTDGPHIFRDSKEIVYVKGVKNKFRIERQKYNTLPDSLTCYVSQRDSFRFKLQHSYKVDTGVYPMPERMFVLSDIEGNFSGFKGLLVGNKITDSNLNWIYGNGHMVLIGDMVDRGTEVTQCLWLIYKLEQEAAAQGGKVHYILGNHEVMNFHGNAKYVEGKYLELIRRRKMLYHELYAPNTELGKWMRSKNLVEQIGDIIFVHGGISQQVSGEGFTIDEMNRLAHQYIDTRHSDIPDSRARMLMGRGGIIWYRGLVTAYGIQKVNQNAVDIITENMHCKRIAMGHTVVQDISFDFDGKVIRTNVRHAVREPGALFIENGKFYRTDTKGNREEMDSD
jgi:hypothetical protein